MYVAISITITLISIPVETSGTKHLPCITMKFDILNIVESIEYSRALRCYTPEVILLPTNILIIFIKIFLGGKS